ncbi:toxin-antitoxin system TumE family protein [Halalkalicoccus tibetensis]|uniref:DUF6516 family protein n=1 Tax=Halalkalicoccus tibetensis TaxID=175632 RepID=A0ABD5VEB8_9EURY
MPEDDDATLLLETRQNFGDTYAEVRAWDVPPSERYPDGVHYSMQYGTTDGSLIFRYDNFPDHPGAAEHHKHIGESRVEDIDFPGVLDLYRRFKAEVNDHENGQWK